MSEITRSSDDRDVVIATLYGEARNEEDDNALVWLAWVIKNRAQQNRPQWGGSRLKDVCLHPCQFECWVLNSKGVRLSDEAARARCAAIVDRVLNSSEDPTEGSDSFNKPSRDFILTGTGYPDWTKNSVKLKRFGEFQFYRTV